MDRMTPEQRRRCMSNIRGKDTKPELLVRSFLHRSGFRFRLHRKDLPGRPDFVLPRYRTVIFVHGCFWHRHPGCPKATVPEVRKEFWEEKFRRNVERDRRSRRALEDLGWRVIVLWECRISDRETLTEDLAPLLAGRECLGSDEDGDAR